MGAFGAPGLWTRRVFLFYFFLSHKNNEGWKQDMAFRCLLHLTWAWLPRRTLIETSRPISKALALAAMHRWLKLLVVSGTSTNIVFHDLTDRGYWSRHIPLCVDRLILYIWRAPTHLLSVAGWLDDPDRPDWTLSWCLNMCPAFTMIGKSSEKESTCYLCWLHCW